MIDVLLCCAGVIMCAGLRTFIESQRGIRIVGEVDEPREAVTMALRTRPTVVLAARLDFSPGEIERMSKNSKIVVLTSEEPTAEQLLGAFSAGVNATLAESSLPTTLVHTIRIVAVSDMRVVPGTAMDLLEAIRSRGVSDGCRRVLDTLTRREAEVLLLLTQGHSTAEIAGKFSVSMATIRSHVHNLLRKTRTGSCTQLVAAAYSHGLVDALAGRECVEVGPRRAG